MSTLDGKTRSALLQLLTPTQWSIINESFSRTTFQTALVDEVYAVNQFLKDLTNSPEFESAVQQLAPATPDGTGDGTIAALPSETAFAPSL